MLYMLVLVFTFTDGSKHQLVMDMDLTSDECVATIEANRELAKHKLLYCKPMPKQDSL